MANSVTVTKTLEVPYLVEANDYHEFGHMEDELQELYNTRRIKVEEIGCTYHLPPGCNYYVGVVYTRKDADYRRLKKEARRDFNMDEY
jgi:hypothetical protein